MTPPPWTPFRHLAPQPLVGIITSVLAGAVLVAAWLPAGGSARSLTSVSGAVTVVLVGAISVAYRFPLPLGRQTKVQMGSVPYYLLAVLMPLPLATLGAGVGAVLGELSVKRQRGTTVSDLATTAGRRVLVEVLGSTVAHLPTTAQTHVLVLVGVVIVMGATDLLTFPLVLAPMRGERPLRVIAAVAQDAALMEGTQYLLGLLAALVAAEQVGAVALVALPTALVYLAFRAMAQGAEAQQAADAARRRAQDSEQHLALLLDITQALTATLEPDQIAQVLTVRLLPVLNASRVVVTPLPQPERGPVAPLGIVGAISVPGTADDREASEVAAHAYWLAQAVRTGRPFYSQIDHADVPREERSYLLQRGQQAELLIPITVQGQIRCVLEVSWSQSVPLSTETRALCVASADQAGMALTNACLYAEARMRADHDALTGLLDHTAVVAAVDSELLRARRYRRRCALIFLDVDHFKEVNDTYGHLAGDAALRAIAAVLQTTLRSIDVSGRWGGEEFVVILSETDREAARTTAEHLRVAVAEATRNRDPYGALTCSLGVAVYPDDAADRDTLVALADQAMYTAKQRGRNQVCLAAAPRVSTDGGRQRSGE